MKTTHTGSQVLEVIFNSLEEEGDEEQPAEEEEEVLEEENITENDEDFAWTDEEESSDEEEPAENENIFQRSKCSGEKMETLTSTHKVTVPIKSIH